MSLTLLLVLAIYLVVPSSSFRPSRSLPRERSTYLNNVSSEGLNFKRALLQGGAFLIAGTAATILAEKVSAIGRPKSQYPVVGSENIMAKKVYGKPMSTFVVVKFGNHRLARNPLARYVGH